MTDTEKEKKQIQVKDLENGPLEDRECRDVLCLLLFIANVAAMAYCSYYAYLNGNVYNIFRGTDPNMNICGVGSTLGYPYLYFPNVMSLSTNNRVCVQECPKYVGSSLSSLICYPNSVVTSCNYDYTIAQDGQSVSPNSPAPGLNNFGYTSSAILDRICLPDASVFSYLTTQGTDAANSFKSYMQQGYLMNLVTDIQNNWQLMLAGIGISIVISFVIMFLMRCLAGLIVWASILGTILSLVALGLLFMYSGGQFGSPTQTFMGQTIPTVGTDVAYIKYYGYAILGVAGLFMLIMLCLCNRIRLAVALCSCAGKFIVDVMSTVLVPIVMSLFTAALWVVCFICMIYLVSSATFIAESGQVFTTFATYKDQSLVRFYYFIFGTLWCNTLLGAIGIFLIASAACMWYYSHGPGQDLHFPIVRSLGRIFRYHLGSLAFGALILAIIQFLELIVQAVKSHLSSTGADKNKVVEYILTCVQCFLACLQRVVSFLNKNAYIQIALRGKNFCMASKDGFQIIWSNPARFAVVGGIGTVIMFIGKLLISSATTTIMWAIFSYSGWAKIINPFLPLLIVFVYSYVVSSVFMTVYELAMDSLLVCFIVDESNQKEGGMTSAKHAPEELIALMD